MQLRRKIKAVITLLTFSWMGELCDLSPPSSESYKVHTFMVVCDIATQQSSLYCLPIGETAHDALKEIKRGSLSSPFRHEV